jgi:hypothetical protein
MPLLKTFTSKTSKVKNHVNLCPFPLCLYPNHMLTNLSGICNRIHKTQPSHVGPLHPSMSPGDLKSPTKAATLASTTTKRPAANREAPTATLKNGKPHLNSTKINPSRGPSTKTPTTLTTPLSPPGTAGEWLDDPYQIFGSAYAGLGF